MLPVRAAQRVYTMGSSQVHALRGVNLEIDSGEFVADSIALGIRRLSVIDVARQAVPR